jgi:hypothetical protein
MLARGFDDDRHEHRAPGVDRRELESGLVLEQAGDAALAVPGCLSKPPDTQPIEPFDRDEIGRVRQHGTPRRVPAHATTVEAGHCVRGDGFRHTPSLRTIVQIVYARSFV